MGETAAEEKLKRQISGLNIGVKERKGAINEISDESSSSAERYFAAGLTVTVPGLGGEIISPT